VIRLELSPEDLAKTRLAFSPFWEAVFAFRAMADPAGHAMHRPWTEEARRATASLDLRTMFAVVALTGVVFEFLTRVPERPGVPFGEELDRFRATPPGDLAEDIGRHYELAGGPPPADIRPILDRPGAGLERLAGELGQFWNAALAPHWPAIRALLESETLRSAHRQVTGGTDALLAGLHPRLAWDGSALELEGPPDAGLSAGGRGAVVVANVFAWPDVMARQTREGVPVIAYPAAGTAALWPSPTPASSQALEILVGRERASVLQALHAPRSTTDLAAMLRLAVSSVSYHLGMLRQAGLVDSHRSGKRVLYRLSPLGEHLLGLWERPAAASSILERRTHWQEAGWVSRYLSKNFESFPPLRPLA
jgi:DNA-binding transcriptional ArsR family regulator